MEHGILFTGPMVRAIIEGRKTQTRRVIMPEPLGALHAVGQIDTMGFHGFGAMFREPMSLWIEADKPSYSYRRCPYGRPGDLLWVRETWAPVGECGHYNHLHGERQRAIYAADNRCFPERWRPSIHMPRWASRLTLRLTDVRVQRLQDISEQDAEAEGVVKRQDKTCGGHVGGWPATKYFINVWDSINGKRAPWESNPWVWVLSFERVKGRR